MTSTPPDREPQFRSGHPEEGKVAAVIAWALYILSIPSANVLVLVGLACAAFFLASAIEAGQGVFQSVRGVR